MRARVAFAVVLSSLATVSPASGAEASCAFLVNWEGRSYEALGVNVSPLVGRSLGSGQSPACNDTGPETQPEKPERVPLAVLRGARPRDALVAVGYDQLVLVRSSLDEVPEAVHRLLVAPRCTSAEDLFLRGRWLGILSANGRTETDLKPPYVLDIHVHQASKPCYLRAFLKIRVPARLGEPITRDEVENYLWHDGDIKTRVRCVRGQYVAEKVDARPPR
jgi:hypothetical protein